MYQGVFAFWRVTSDTYVFDQLGKTAFYFYFLLLLRLVPRSKQLRVDKQTINYTDSLVPRDAKTAPHIYNLPAHAQVYITEYAALLLSIIPLNFSPPPPPPPPPPTSKLVNNPPSSSLSSAPLAYPPPSPAVNTVFTTAPATATPTAPANIPPAVAPPRITSPLAPVATRTSRSVAVIVERKEKKLTATEPAAAQSSPRATMDARMCEAREVRMLK